MSITDTKQTEEKIPKAIGDAIPKTLLFTPIMPGEGSVGELFLRDLCLSFPKDKICCYSPFTLSYGVGVPSPALDWLPMLKVDLPIEHMVSKWDTPFTNKLKAFTHLPKHYKKLLPPLIDEAIAYAKAQKAEQILAVLCSPSVIHMVKSIVERSGLRLICLVWDPIATTMGYLNFDDYHQKKVLKEVDEVLSMASGIALPSPWMQKKFAERFKAQSQILNRPVPTNLVEEGCRENKRTERFVIGFAGSIYAREEFLALIKALNSCHWKIDNRAVTLRILGNFMHVPISTPGISAHVEFLGFRELPEAVKLLAECDMTYLPYWLDPKYKDSVLGCFPDKLSTYVAAGKPILYHGPYESSPRKFFDRFPIGIQCHSHEPADLVSCFTKIATDDVLHHNAFNARKDALAKELNPEIFHSRLMKLVSLP